MTEEKKTQGQIQNGKRSLTSFIDNDTKRVFECKNLHVTNVGLTELPSQQLHMFSNLIRLDLSHNKLTSLPEAFRFLKKLTWLDLSHNRMVEVPYCFSNGLGCLTYLDLSYNQLKDIYIEKCSELLEVIKLNNNALNVIPYWLLTEECHSIKELHLSNNPCLKASHICSSFVEDLHLPHQMKNSISKTVKKLYLSNCRVNDTNVNFLSVFDTLEELYLGEDSCNVLNGTMRNLLLSLPLKYIKNAHNVKILNVCNLSLPSMNERINKFVNLRHFDASHNFISWLPDSLCELKHLETCNLSFNSISSLPEKLGQLSSLQKLYLSQNNLSNLPESFKDMHNLRVLDLYCNILVNVPDVVWELELEGLDLEYNCFQTNLGMSEEMSRKYEKMRNVVSGEAGHRFIRLVGPNPECEIKDCTEGSDTSSEYGEANYKLEPNCLSCEMESRSLEDDYEDETVGFVQMENDTGYEEDWDEDINDNFNPSSVGSYCGHSIPSTSTSYIQMKNEWTDDENDYYPFVFHAELIKYTVYWMEPIEGQFDNCA